MSAFEFFFSFYGLVLGLSVAVMATGAARAFKHRQTVRVGWMTPLLALFVALDIATFWDSAWNSFRALPYSYGLIIAGMVIAAVYFIAASLIFPEAEDAPAGLDDHFWANKRTVLLLTVLANAMSVGVILGVNAAHGQQQTLVWHYLTTLGVYVVLTVPAALTRRRWLFAVLVGLQVAIYLILASLSLAFPEVSAATEALATAEAPAEAAP